MLMKEGTRIDLAYSMMCATYEHLDKCLMHDNAKVMEIKIIINLVNHMRCIVRCYETIDEVNDISCMDV